MDDEVSEAELAGIEHAARAATPGPWRWVDSATLAMADGAGVLTKRSNREYVQRMTPDLALRLIDELRFLRRLQEVQAKVTPAAPRRRRPRPAAK